MRPTELGQQTSRELELELARVRAEAAAVRLEARAAEIELLLLELTRPGGSAATIAPTPAENGGNAASHWPLGDNSVSALLETLAPPAGGEDRRATAEALIAAIRQLLFAPQSSLPREDHAALAAAPRAAATILAEPESVAEAESMSAGKSMAGPELAAVHSHSTAPTPASPELLAFLSDRQAAGKAAGAAITSAAGQAVAAQPNDLAAKRGPRPRPQPVPAKTAAAPSDSSATPDIEVKSPDKSPSRERHSGDSRSRAAPSRESSSDNTPSRKPLVAADPQRLSTAAAAEWQLVEAPSAEPAERPLRPAAWLVSAIGHVLLLVMLGLMSLAAQPPRDQMAFSAAAAEVSEQVIDTFTIETSELSAEETPPQPAEAAIEVSPVGTLPLAEVSLDLPEVMPLATADLLSSQTSSMTSLSRAPRGDTEANVQFAGVAGGGNHFVYLVDSSQSMRNFNEARMELLRSVDALKNDQRFYVIFYDQDPDRMRLSDPGLDEPTSVLATPANKAALRRWAMTVRQQRGKSPIDVLPFAFRLRPDTIFLLSDGEFAARTEEVIREHNRRDNLFGEDGPVSIIHTIRFPGATAAEARNAEVQMQRIAHENGGQYRNVVIP